MRRVLVVGAAASALVNAAGLSFQSAADLPAPAVALAALDAEVFALDALGERIFGFRLTDSSLVLADTVFLPEPVFPARALGADPFFFYVATDRALVRFRRTSAALDTVWSADEPFALGGFATTPRGELLIADAPRDQVLVLGANRDRRATIGPGTVVRPAGVAVDSAGEVIVVSRVRSALAAFTRIGEPLWVRALPVPGIERVVFTGRDFVLAAPGDSRLYLVSDSARAVTVADAPGHHFELSDVAAAAGRLIVLDHGQTLLVFARPGP